MRLSKTIKSSSFRTLGVFAGGNLFVAVLGGLGGLIQARWIGPEILGEFAKFGILTAYCNVGLVLVHDGLSRQFPYLLGKGNKDAAIEIAATAKWWYLLLCWFFSLIFAALSLMSVIKGNYRSAVGWAAQIPFIWSAIYGVYLGVMYRSSSDFKRLSYNSVIAKVVDFSSLVAVKLWGYWGLAARTVIGSTMGLYLGRHYVPVKVKATLDVKVLKDLAKISLPISIPGYIGTSFLTASLSFIILKYCGQHGLGIYAMAFTFQAVAMTLTGAIQQMFITKLTYKFGETEDIAACLKWAMRPTFLSVGASTVLALALCCVIGPFISILLPKYMDAIPVIRILALQLPLSAAGLPLLLINAALWYKSKAALTLTNVLVCLTAVAMLPKTINVIVACIIFGGVCQLIAGYSILGWNWRNRETGST
jgi:O-antigen/teichoic acid export membrane protein